jgi:hypothetical protein
MVCTKCQKKLKTTELATPGVKKKSEMYYGSPAASVGGGSGSGGGKPTMGNTGVGKVCYLSYILRIRVHIYNVPMCCWCLADEGIE